MPRASAAVAAKTARDIQTAATSLFASRGYAAVSIDDIAGRSGVTRGAVYHHYRSKEGLFWAVAASLQADVAEAVLAAADRGGSDAAARLRAGCHGFLDAITGGPAARILLIEAPAALGWAQWRSLDSEHSMVHLRAGLSAVGVAPELVDAATAQLSGAMNEGALWIAEQRDPRRARELAHQVLDRLLDANLD